MLETDFSATKTWMKNEQNNQAIQSLDAHQSESAVSLAMFGSGVQIGGNGATA